jgi:hypothetical protein
MPTGTGGTRVSEAQHGRNNTVALDTLGSSESATPGAGVVHAHRPSNELASITIKLTIIGGLLEELASWAWLGL